MGQCDLRGFRLLRLLCSAPAHGRAHLLHSVRVATREQSAMSATSVCFACDSSCDLDEWTTDQLQIMKIGGNANGISFLKRHGLTETNMKVH
jgi:hypothetical protein